MTRNEAPKNNQVLAEGPAQLLDENRDLASVQSFPYHLQNLQNQYGEGVVFDESRYAEDNKARRIQDRAEFQEAMRTGGRRFASRAAVGDIILRPLVDKPENTYNQAEQPLKDV